MTGNRFQAMARRTARKDLDWQGRMTEGALGLAGEAGEVVDLVKKLTCQGHPFDEAARCRIEEELGDMFWYAAAIATASGLRFDDIMRANLRKLEERYPDGFDPERSIRRIK